ncbi:MAG: M42 family metallopeptidase [Candidatus Heimdallarchaeota archaeon]|nr:MAG: M42 family metallopeptidase [Candidatus Heimdallarchaeota archaeon]
MENKKISEIKTLQKELSEIIGVSGYEKPVVDFIQTQIEGLVDKMWIDPLGSLLATIKGDENERIMIDAHLDEIGFMISHIDPQGFLRFVSIGGWDVRILLGQAVKILAVDGKEYHGIIGSKPPHLTTESERKNMVKINEMYIDLGLSSKEEVEDIGINIGSVGTLYDPFVEFPNNMVRGKAFDDRTGVNVLINIIREFSSVSPTPTLQFSFSMGEEIGGRGAGTAAFSLDPTMALAIENTTAGDVPGIKHSECPAYIGKGPAITVADRSMISHPKVNERLIENAKVEDIPYQIKKPIFGGTNAGRIHITRRGIPASVVSVPCRYIHSPTSLLSISDIYQTIRLVTTFIHNPANINLTS